MRLMTFRCEGFGRRRIWWAWMVAEALGLAFAGMAQSASVTINGAQTFQTIEGFGVNANHRSWNNNELKPVLDALVDQAGMTLFRVLYDNTDWEAVNDNSDPNVMDWNYYNALYSNAEFQKMWDLVAYLNQKGLSSGVGFNFQGGGPSWLGSRYLNSGYEAEWAEMIASLVIYARTNRHLQFGLLNPANEPDNTSDSRTQGILMSTSQYVTAMHKLAQLLDTNGISNLRFVGPDLAYTSTSWMSAMMSDSLLMGKLAHFGLHSYQDAGGGSTGISAFLQQSPYPDRTFWMTEFNAWCSSCESCVGGDNSWSFARSTASYLLYHLANGASAGIIWEGYDSFYNISGCWSYWGLLAVDNINAATKTYTPRKGFYTISQFSKFVRPGARRIAVSGSTSPLLLLAFYQADTGQVTLVGINTSGSPAALSGTLTALPAVSSLDLYYTSSSANLSHSASFPVSGGTFSATVPADSVFTLVGAAPTLSVNLLSPTNDAVFSAPATIPLQAGVSNSAGNPAQVAFFNGANQLGQVSTPPYSLLWSNVLAGTYSLTAQASNSAGQVAISPAVQLTVIGPLAQISVVPSNAIVPLSGQQLFTATAADALGTPLQPQPAFSWSASGGGTMDAGGLFTAGAAPGGPFTIQASSGDVSGSALVTISANLAFGGSGYTWYGLSSPTANSPRATVPGMNDGNLSTSIHLLPGNGTTDTANAYEAAGIVWSNLQAIGSVVYSSGSYDSASNGVFDAGFRLQFSLDGSTWSDAGPGWTLTPAYLYDSPLSASTNFTFSGNVTNVLGVRVLGQVHTGATPTNSWVASAAEVQAFGPSPLLTISQTANGLLLSWPGSLTQFQLESTTDLGPGGVWTPVTNTLQQQNGYQSVTIVPLNEQQFFRLRQR